MWTTIVRLVRPPLPGARREAQRTWLVQVMLKVACTAAFAAGLVLLAAGWYRVAATVLLAAAACGIGIVAGRYHRDRLAAITLITAMYVGLLGAAYFGDGLYDEATVAFPILILAAAFLFGRDWGLILVTLALVAATSGLYVLHAYGVIAIPTRTSPTRLVILPIVLFAMAGTAWIVRDTWENATRSLAESYDETLRGWARLLEMKGGDVAGHSERVTELSIALAKRLGCTTEDMDALRRGAYLHDLGKLALPDQILMNPGALDPSEREIVEQHPTLGRDLVSGIPFLRSAVCVVYSHHERWDGDGYPEGLAGEQIPRIARIFTVADQWDALNSDRPYRNKWPHEDILSYMRENTGKIYDPEVVEALMAVLGEDA